MALKPGKKIQIHSYKHDHSLHRIWARSHVILEQENLLVTVNKHTKVIECNGRSWFTKEPAVCYFFDNHWFNVIGMLKADGVHYYCNMSSPYLFDKEAIKYIDYDLDVKVLPSGKMIILDQKEYVMHSEQMAYPDDIKAIITKEMDVLKSWIKEKKYPFNPKLVYRDYEIYEQKIMKTKE